MAGAGGVRIIVVEEGADGAAAVASLASAGHTVDGPHAATSPDHAVELAREAAAAGQGALLLAAGSGVLSLPGAPDAVLAAVNQLLAPLVGATGAAPSDGPEPPEVPAGISFTRLDAGEEGEEAEPERASGWKAALRALGGTIDPEGWPELPENLDRVAPARNVLDTAGERALVRFEDGRTAGIFGFPDLRRDRSKVLMVADGEPFAEIAALHRHPHPVGLVSFGDAGALPSADLDPDPIARERVGQPLPSFGTLFAVEPSAVYVERDGRIYKWDGRHETDEGRPAQALASLMLHWSSR